MIYPPINKLMERVDSRYTLVVVTAKRARNIAEGSPKLTECNSDKPVTVAVHEIAEGKIKYRRTKDSVK